ncbi:Uncharacterised protein [Sphingobacterium thalpophilum]|uniref:Uncharacterized protein n=1 Tax=Sphingobacterium thalpophilum TaxID=259 RepID=A0A4V6KPD9_9SPHI|nr:Uncharacterised protein [Sphingobacterium thalpophilum]
MGFWEFSKVRYFMGKGSELTGKAVEMWRPLGMVWHWKECNIIRDTAVKK